MKDNKKEYSAPSQDKVKKQRKQAYWSRVAVSVVLLISVALLLACILITFARDIFGINKQDQQIEVSIAAGSSATDIARTLKEEGVINYSSAFLAYCSLRGDRSNFQAGNYIMNSNMGYDEIIIAMRTGNTIKNVVSVTFYEGMSIREIADNLQKNEVCSADEFINTLQTTDFGFEFEDMLPKKELRFRRLEGYLFPDTYEFYVGEAPESVAKKFLRNFQSKVFPQLYEQIQNAGMTLDEAVTLASVIQEEASVEEEMFRVSSVFHNRLAQPSVYPNLQSDVTIFYVEKDIKPYQMRANQDMYDAYNTYVCVGLPIGPVCSPGIAAIKAAVKPADTQYYFFVTDAKGKYYYAKDAQTHYANVRTASKVTK